MRASRIRVPRDRTARGGRSRERERERKGALVCEYASAGTSKWERKPAPGTHVACSRVRPCRLARVVICPHVPRSHSPLAAACALSSRRLAVLSSPRTTPRRRRRRRQRRPARPLPSLFDRLVVAWHSLDSPPPVSPSSSHLRNSGSPCMRARARTCVLLSYTRRELSADTRARVDRDRPW